MIHNFKLFIDESYLESNFAPLYHFTTVFVLNEILISNTLDIGYYENPVFGELKKFISLTRFKNFKNHRESNIRIELDKLKLTFNHKIIPYDYFINAKKEKYPKSNLKRIEKVQYEEIILNKISNFNIYLKSINFNIPDDYYKIEKNLMEYLDKYKLNIDIFIQNIKI